MDYLSLYLIVIFRDEELEAQINCPSLSINDIKKTTFFTRREIKGWNSRIEHMVYSPSPDDEAWIKQKGGGIFEVLFGENQKKWRKYLEEIISFSNEEELGIRIHICSKDKLSDEVPWELMYDSVSDKFLGCSARYVIVRTPIDYFPSIEDKSPSIVSLGKK